MEEADLENVLLAAIQLQVRLLQDIGLEVKEDAEGRLMEEIKSCQAAVSRYNVLQAETKHRFKELADQLAQAHGVQERKGIDFGKYVFVKELSRELLEELVKENRVSGKGIMKIVWNFEEPWQ